MNILISPLNWGLGHATRIVTIIKNLALQNKITIAACGSSAEILKNEFPNLEHVQSPLLEIKYSDKKINSQLKYGLLIPKLVKFYIQNRRFIRQFTKTNKVDLIISDNSFGFFSKKIRSIFITHQINIQFRSKLAQKIAFLLNKINIEKFDECLIPDSIYGFKFSGKLSDSSKIKITCRNIGILSRFDRSKKMQEVEKVEIIAILSGPEPYRSIFEKKIVEILSKTNLKSLIVQGLPKNKFSKIIGNLKIVNNLSTNEMQDFLTQTPIIITRSGYSTIMDLAYLRKTALIIPTPSQTEQEFLAKYLHQHKLFYTCNQGDFSLESINKFKEIKNIMQKNIENLKFDVFNELNISE